jgi:hypothetical protein
MVMGGGGVRLFGADNCRPGSDKEGILLNLLLAASFLSVATCDALFVHEFVLGAFNFMCAVRDSAALCISASRPVLGTKGLSDFVLSFSDPFIALLLCLLPSAYTPLRLLSTLDSTTPLSFDPRDAAVTDL